jgi:hypothetical protein
VAGFIEGMWDDAIAGIRQLIERVQARDRNRHEQERLVAQLTASSGDRFRIEPDQIPQVIADLHSALGRIKEIRIQADSIANTVAPGSDEVSTNAVLQIGHMAMGEERSLKAALDVYEAEINKTIDGLEQDLKTYLGTEHLNIPPATAWP